MAIPLTLFMKSQGENCIRWTAVGNLACVVFIT